MKTVAFIGLGKIAQIAVDAIEQVRGIEIVGGYDAATEPDWGKERGWCSPLQELLNLKSETVIVSTPSPAHAQVVREVWNINPSQRALVEKPLVTDIPEVQALLGEAKPKTPSVSHNLSKAASEESIIRCKWLLNIHITSFWKL